MAPRGSVAGGTLCALLGGAVRSLPRAPVAALQVDDPLGGIGAVCPILRRQREKAPGGSVSQRRRNTPRREAGARGGQQRGPRLRRQIGSVRDATHVVRRAPVVAHGLAREAWMASGFAGTRQRQRPRRANELTRVCNSARKPTRRDRPHQLGTRAAGFAMQLGRRDFPHIGVDFGQRWLHGHHGDVARDLVARPGGICGS